MSLKIIPTRVNQTAAQWALDNTVYPSWKILCVTDQFVTGTDQPMIKYADGVQTFAQLDFVPDVLIPLNDHINDNANPHAVTLEQARLSDNFFEGEVDMNGERLRNLPVPLNADEAVNKSYVDGLVDNTLKPAEAFSPSGSYPVTYGGNPVQKGDSFRVSAGTMGAVTVEGEELLIALIDTPGQTDSNWQILESNRNQATESVMGIAKIATQATVEDELTSNNTDIVTPQKFWFGILKFLTLPWTWSAKQTHTLAPRFNSAGASQYLKTDGSKDLTSSATIPTSDITGTKTHTFISDFDTQVSTSTITLTNKRITKRVTAVASSATPTVNSDNMDIARITGLAVNVTNFSTNLTGTPGHGDFLCYELTDNGTARTLTWGTSFAAAGTLALPTTTVINTLLKVLFQWDTAQNKWVISAVV